MALGAPQDAVSGAAVGAAADAAAGAGGGAGGGTGGGAGGGASEESLSAVAAAVAGGVGALPFNGSCPLNWTQCANGTAAPEQLRDLVPYIVPALFALIFVVGVLGNGTLVFIFARHRQLRNAPNTYILSLALGDLLLIVTCVPFTSTLYTFDSWPYGALICKLSEGVKDVSIGVSVFTLTALSAERYCAITNPMRRHAGGQAGGRLVTLLAAAGIWVLATIFALPDVINSHVMVVPIPEIGQTIKVCYPFPKELGTPYSKAMVMSKFLLYYAIPLCIIACFYVLMALHLEASTRNMPGELQGQSSQIRARKKVAKLVLLFVIIFILCFLPHHMFMLWFHFNPASHEEYDDFWNALRIVGFCLSFINSCINPIALYLVSGAFRKHFNRYLFCCCARGGGSGGGAAGIHSSVSGRSHRRKGRCSLESSHSMAHFNSSTVLRRVPSQTTVFHLENSSRTSPASQAATSKPANNF